MLDLYGHSGPILNGSPSTETPDIVTSASSHHGSEDALSRMLPRLGHMDLTGRVSNKNAVTQAYGGYCDVFVGHAASEDVRHRCIIPIGVREVKVAIKRLRVRLGKDKQLAKSLAREMGIWSRLNHPNILPLPGYLLEEDFPSLVSEWMENGTVKDFVKNNTQCDLIYLVLGIAKGLEFLHDKDIVHSDMKADNVLISQSGEPLICDFGISRMLNSSQTFFVSTTHARDGVVKGSTRWMAIELLMPDAGADAKHTKETDVWAYGMMLYEIITKQVPYAHLKNDAQVLLAIVNGEVPTEPTFVNQFSFLMGLYISCIKCWEEDPKVRITMTQTTATLKRTEVQYQGIIAYKTEQANFGWSSVDEQDNHRRPDNISFPGFEHGLFLALVQDWWERNGIKPNARVTMIDNRQIGIYMLYNEVQVCGGLVNVRHHHLWNHDGMDAN